MVMRVNQSTVKWCQRNQNDYLKDAIIPCRVEGNLWVLIPMGFVTIAKSTWLESTRLEPILFDFPSARDLDPTFCFSWYNLRLITSCAETKT